VWDLIAHDQASATFRRVGASAGAAGVETEAMGGKFAKAGAVVATGAAVAAVAAVAVGVAATKMAADFQSATTLLVTGAGESEKSIGLVRDGLLAMAPAVGMGPEALATAMFQVESAGFHGAAGLTVMKAAAEGAKIGGADATVVANGLTTALTDYHLPANRAAEVTSKLVATVAAGKTTMGDLSASLSTILPFASSFGVSLNDVAGAMATMTGEGIDAATASTMLKFTMMSMANETPKGLTALKSIGMSAQQLKDDLSKKGVGGALQDVTDAIGKKFPAGSVAATHALAAIVGGTRGMGSALALTGTHAATLTANIKSISGATTEADGGVKGWALTQKDLNFQFDRAKSLISSIAITIGDKLIPYVTAAVAGFNNFVAAVQKSFSGGGISKVFTDFGAKISAELPIIAAKLAAWGKAFVEWIAPMIPPFLAKLGNLLVRVGNWLIAALPVIAARLAKWGAAFAAWIGPIIGPVLLALGKFRLKMEIWLYTVALPAIVKQLGKWALAFVKWIGPMIPPFIVEMGKLLLKLGGWLGTVALPAIVTKLGQWAAAFIKWVGPAATKLIIELGQLLNKLTVWAITVALPAIILKLATWAGAFFRWVGPASAKMIGELVILGAKLFYWLGTTALPRIVSEVGKWALALVKWIPGAALKLVTEGGKLTDGLLRGLQAAPGKIFDAIKAVGGLIIRAVKDFFGIKSPSTIMAGLGGHIIGGLIQGIIKNKDQVPKLLGKVFGDVKSGIGGVLGWLGSQGGGLLGKVLGGAGNLGKAFGSLFTGGGAGGGGGAMQWMPQISQVLGMLGQPMSLAAGVLRRIMFESGGNPNAINLTDSNAQAGHPSQGLMQTIPSTFAAYAGPFAGLGITNGLANIYAGLNYAIHRYGSVAAIDPLVMPSGYDTGGMLNPGATGRNFGKLPERVLSGTQTQAFERLVASLERGGSGDLLSELQGLRADIRALPRSYQMGQRQMAGAQ